MSKTHALLDVTRRLSPEEMAELQLEQGYIDRALRIYDELVAEDPSNATYSARRAWLARLLASSRRSEPRRRRGTAPFGTVEAPRQGDPRVVRRRIVPVR